MNDFLSFGLELLTRGRRLFECGQDREARRCLEHLLSHTDTPLADRVSAHRLLADIHSRQNCHRQARKRLAAALILEPTCPDLHHRMAQAILADPEASPKRAWNHLNLAIAMRPQVPEYWCSLGRTALKLHRPKEAARCFRKTLTLKPSEPKLLDELAEGLAMLDRAELSAVMLERGGFALRPQDRAYLQRQFRMYAALQVGEDSHEKATILSFPEVERRNVSESGEIIRIDRASTPTPRHLAFNEMRADR